MLFSHNYGVLFIHSMLFVSPLTIYLFSEFSSKQTKLVHVFTLNDIILNPWKKEVKGSYQFSYMSLSFTEMQSYCEILERYIVLNSRLSFLLCLAL